MELISQVKANGAYGAYQERFWPSAPVDYVYLDEKAGNEELGRIASLEGLEHLERLVIVGSRITNAGLVHLKRFPKLRDVYFRDTPVTNLALDQLRRELPNCVIVFDKDN